jgi:N-acetyl sugar amidotransferase
MEYKICSRCIMDTSDSEIIFDKHGVCNHCLRYYTLKETRIIPREEAADKMKLLVDKIRLKGKGKEYDCIVGVSGGVDSTYVVYLAKKNGLKPLAVHLDNGWNSDLATKNIHKVLKKMDIDLVTHVIDWREFKSLQKSFLDASVPDGEIPTDHAISAILWKTADKYNIKFILSGMNFATESFSVPTWAYGHSDWKYIKSIHKIFRNYNLNSYPHFGFMYLFYINFIKNVRIISLLNYIDYNKSETIKLLERELGWLNYGGKHYESIYTRFYQGFILPKKFNIDKRIGHLSDLINSGQITRDEALIEIDKPALSKEMLRDDTLFVMKKLDYTEKSFAQMLSSKNKLFKDYPNSYSFVQFLRQLVNVLRKFDLYPK